MKKIKLSIEKIQQRMLNPILFKAKKKDTKKLSIEQIKKRGLYYNESKDQIVAKLEGIDIIFPKGRYYYEFWNKLNGSFRRKGNKIIFKVGEGDFKLKRRKSKEQNRFVSDREISKHYGKIWCLLTNNHIFFIEKQCN